MRTTITLEDDLVEKIRAEMRRRRTDNFKETINDILRQGLMVRRDFEKVKPFKVRARKMGIRPELNYDNIEELLDSLEGVYHR